MRSGLGTVTPAATVPLWCTAVSLLLLSMVLSAEGEPANDDFVNGVPLTGTNISYAGDLAGATLEPGEPAEGETNTIWVSWAAPSSGAVTKVRTSFDWFVYTGPSVDQLTPVRLVPLYFNKQYRFWVTAGAVYHMQLSGSPSSVTLEFQLTPEEECSNDDFTSAAMVKGKNTFGPKPVECATMEFAEPLHMGAVPQKSIWWIWQAPQHGLYYIDPRSSIATNFVLTAYYGNTVEALTPVATSTNTHLYFTAEGGRSYHFAAAVPTNIDGDIRGRIASGAIDTVSHLVPGNLLLEPSWEGTALYPLHWGRSGNIGGYVNHMFPGADGITWPNLAGGAKIWQDFPTVPGHEYEVRFAFKAGGAQVGVWWDSNLVGTSSIPVEEGSFWHWHTYLTVASNSSSRIAFENIGGPQVEMDAFSVVDLRDPPTIVNQPASVSTVGGGTVAFAGGATGTSPLAYQWFFDDAPLADKTNSILILTSVSTNQAGDYFAIITNRFGAVTSAVASLLVDAPAYSTIVWQPYGDTVAVGGYYRFSVTAIGTPPLTYQWHFNGVALDGATGKMLTYTNVQPTNAGTYQVAVSNPAGMVWSLPATPIVSTNIIGGGTIDFRNLFVTAITNEYPVFDLDGVTLLSGSTYLAQLYAGPSLDKLRPAGLPTPFQTGFDTGYFVAQLVTLPDVAPGSNCVVQVRAWKSSQGDSFEEARALGGKFGKSGIFEMTAGGGVNPAPYLVGMRSFHLEAGLPLFQVGHLEFVQRQTNQLVWALHGQPGSLYLIETSAQFREPLWQPFAVVTNVTGVVLFTNTLGSGEGAVRSYRARILD